MKGYVLVLMVLLLIRVQGKGFTVQTAQLYVDK